MSELTKEKIIDIFYSIHTGIGNHGSFLKGLSRAVLSADWDNFNLLKPYLEKIIEKYDLNKEPYVSIEND